jgi:hypothetical protein
MNNTKTLAIVAIFMAATLVVGTLASTATTQTALAYQKKNRGGSQENSKNGNTATIQKCKQDGTVSGFDNTAEQECQNVICTHPGENATCTQEGVRSTPTSTPTPTPTPEPITTTLRIIKQVDCQTGSNCSLPSDCTITLQPPQPQQSFPCTSAIGNGVLFTLQPGDSFNVLEAISGGFAVSTRGNCDGTIAAGQHLTCTIINTET